MPSRRGSLPLHQHLLANLRGYFRHFKWRSDVWLGALVGAATVVLQAALRLSALEDWKRHPFDVILSFLIPVAGIVVLDALIRFVRTLCSVYRERDRQLRESVQISLAICLGATWFIAVVGYVSYVTSPHFYGEIRGRFHIGASKGIFSPQPMYVLFDDVLIGNTGVTSTTSDWQLDVHEINGGVVTGDPNFTPPYKRGDFIYIKGENSIERGKTINGPAFFIVQFITETALNIPGTRLVITFKDSRGKVCEIEQTIPATGESRSSN